MIPVGSSSLISFGRIHEHFHELLEAPHLIVIRIQSSMMLKTERIPFFWSISLLSLTNIVIHLINV
jgi:hypothetical protein